MQKLKDKFDDITSWLEICAVILLYPLILIVGLIAGPIQCFNEFTSTIENYRTNHSQSFRNVLLATLALLFSPLLGLSWATFVWFCYGPLAASVGLSCFFQEITKFTSIAP